MLLDLTNHADLRLVGLPEFATALSRFASGVTIVTTDGPGGRWGRTVSSACSLCAEPPSILVCIDRAAPIAEALAANGSFCVNAVSDAQHAVSDLFAGRPPVPMDERFGRASWAPMASGSPALLDAAAAVDCTYAGHVDFGTHRIVIGAVQETRLAASAQPLLYSRRGYGRFLPFAPVGVDA